ncbi:hypothetical protein SLEP1_g32639 [Rubroshorea leprosula]|uniref:DNA polymerase beta thumb domain-containing protein n=1 Tax=Rubroshorea leprosula TaxID=152421 RepID=A0AAV5KDZ8_9ROSI|nr:hypothetical protein SLEP1_g32639 [Rubroshorea leprosula]
MDHRCLNISRREKASCGDLDIIITHPDGKRLRLLADSKGYRLDDTGLFPTTHGSGGKRGTRAITSLKLYTEKEVFDFLGFPWLEPHERNL